MARIVKKSIPWLVFFTVIILATLLFSFNFEVPKVQSESSGATTTVTVGNDTPTFDVVPHEDPTTSSSTPTNMYLEGGSFNTVTFKATVADENGDDVYLAICKDAEITPDSGGGAPTCTGAGGAWVITSVATSTGIITEIYTLTADETAEHYAWYAYACDDNSGGSECTAMSNSGTATGNGTPFAVNHRPTFTVVADDGPKVPGATDLKITATYDDDDSEGTQDLVRLYVCKTDAFTVGSKCASEWCSEETGKDPSETPEELSCTLTIPNPCHHDDGTGESTQTLYYAFVLDSHDLEAVDVPTGGSKHGSSENFRVSNVAPTISGIPSLNAGGSISLAGAEESTKDIYITGTIIDDNGCADIVEASTTADVWQTTLVGLTGCDEASEADNNKCYYHVSCEYVDGCADAGGDPATDFDGNYKCTVSFQYYANPTDAATPWVDDDWTATLIPGDGDGENVSGQATSTAEEMESFLAIALTGGKDAIAYGGVSAGDKSGSEGAEICKETQIRATGNCGLDHNLYGTVMTISGDGHEIAIDNQVYVAGTTTTTHAWADGTELTNEGGSPGDIELECCKSGYSATPETMSTWWGIEIDEGQTSGVYTGANTIEAVKDDWASLGDWCENE